MDIKNKNELKRRIDLFLHDFTPEEYKPEAIPIRTVSEYIRPTLLRRTRSSLRVKTQRVVTQEAITHSLYRRHSRGMMDLCLQETTASYRLYRRAKDETVHIEQKNIQGC